MIITYLEHSGFTIETDSKVLVFDYYQDPQHVVDVYAHTAKETKKPLWFFVSHIHEDHFNKDIVRFKDVTAQYIYNADVPFLAPDAAKDHPMKVYETNAIDDVTVMEYGSTDEGGSFLVKTDGLRIFHAGDLNWWHWLGDTDENNEVAKENFVREMKHLDGKTFDVVFFPVDARLEGTREWGVSAFLNQVNVTKCLIPMHYFGTPWQPTAEFKAKHGNVPLWIPTQPGDSTTVD